MSIFFGTLSMLENGLNYSAAKQKVISQNIANVDTPNYKAKDVSFRAAFNDALSNTSGTNRTDIRHFDFQHSTSNSSVILRNNSVAYNENGNSVDIDQEMADLANNQIYYSALTERLNGKFSSLQNVIRGGK